MSRPYGRGAEFDLLRRLGGLVGDLPREVLVGPGDDAAVLDGGWVASTDLSIEDVHFRRAWISDVEVGYRAATAALSDMAAMAARPVGLLASIAVPGERNVDIEAVQRGLAQGAKAVGASIIGGDLSRSPGPLMIDVVALGQASEPVLRSGARPGDQVWVTGVLGAAGAAVRAWHSGQEPARELRAAFAKPTARAHEARWLVDHEDVRAMIDISDGLVGDAGHIAAASGVKIVLDLSAVPVAEAARDFLGPTEALQVALGGGEDYELCVIVDADSPDPGYLAREHGVVMTRVGSVMDGSGVWTRSEDGGEMEVMSGGFDHWGGMAAEDGTAR